MHKLSYFLTTHSKNDFFSPTDLFEIHVHTMIWKMAAAFKFSNFSVIVLVQFKLNKQIQRIYVPRQDFFKEIRNHLKILIFIGGVTLTLSTYVDSNNA